MAAFTTWMDQVDTILEECVDMKTWELPDGPWYSWFLDDLTPREALEAYADLEGTTIPGINDLTEAE